MLHLFAKQFPDIKLLGEVKTGGILSNQEEQSQQTNLNYDYVLAMASALSGDLVLALPNPDPISIPFADLNTAAAGTYKRLIAVWLQNSNDPPKSHLWYQGTPLITPAKSVVDTDVGVPTIDGTPKFDMGRCLITVEFDTDAGATKEYAANDSVTVQIQVNASDSLLGYSLAAGGVTKTYNVV